MERLRLGRRHCPELVSEERPQAFVGLERSAALPCAASVPIRSLCQVSRKGARATRARAAGELERAEVKLIDLVPPDKLVELAAGSETVLVY